MRELSKSYKADSIAYCHVCREYFIDDLPNFGSIYCPNGCGTCLVRGIGGRHDFDYYEAPKTTGPVILYEQSI